VAVRLPQTRLPRLPQVEIDPTFRRLLIAGVLIGLAYLVIGVIVAAGRHYPPGLQSADKFFSAIGEALFWPLTVAGVHPTLV
jgi:hypothetical protein